tara:strand:- start:62 stop:1309 length:1248 start_codon:yes stop_codon:yes gene_type:complete
MKIYSNINKKKYFQEGNAYSKNTLSYSKISNKISMSKIDKISSNDIISDSKSRGDNKVKNFLKMYVSNKYNIDNRAQYYKYIYSKIAKVKQISCLKSKKFIKKKKIYEGYTIDDTINLQKQIGSNSKYGAIYITSIDKAVGKYPIASKLMEINRSNSVEKCLNEHITTKIMKKKLSRHFIFTYRTFICNNISSNVPPIIKNLNYFVNLNELAHGDLKQLCKNKTYVVDDSLVYNVFIQVMLSIMSFQSIGYTHGDCHYGNFLYQRNIEQGYYFYKINDINYYLKSCKYTMLIFDFGFAKSIDKSNILTYKVIDDYMRIIHAFANKKILSKSWSHYPNYPSDNVSLYTTHLLNKLNSISKALLTNKNKTNKNLNNLINDMIIPHLITAPNNIFTKIKPRGKIINSKPFIINNTLHI